MTRVEVCASAVPLCSPHNVMATAGKGKRSMETFTTHYVRSPGMMFHGSCMVATIIRERGHVSVYDAKTAGNGFTAVRGEEHPHGRCAVCRLTFPDPVLESVPANADGGAWETIMQTVEPPETLPHWESVTVRTISDDDGTSAHGWTVVVSSPSREVVADYVWKTFGDETDPDWMSSYVFPRLRYVSA